MYLSGGRVSDNLTGSPFALRGDQVSVHPRWLLLAPAPPAWLHWGLLLAPTSSPLNVGQMLTSPGEPWLCCHLPWKQTD